jgi:hypothetical protein
MRGITGSLNEGASWAWLGCQYGIPARSVKGA